MAGNTYGSIFRITTFGESHGNGLGVIIDGCPAGIKIDPSKIQAALDKRRPGAAINGIKTAAVTQRSEPDQAEILSGVFEGISEGTPISLLIRNTSQHSKDYGNLVNTFRPGHADYTYDSKYGFRDYRGGGRASGRETAARVAAGSVAAMILEQSGIKATAYTLKAAGIPCKKIDLSNIEQNSMRAPDNDAAKLMEEKIEEYRQNGESTGGIIECIVTGVPAGLGEPVFDKLDAEIAKAILSIGAVKGIEFGAGFAAADSTGSTNNDCMRVKNGKPVFETNNAGGILGGISNGNDIEFRLAVKPVPSIFKSQQTICRNEDVYAETDLEIKGRHDICLCPRIVPVVEAMTNIVLADMLLRNKATRL
ncbi:MAG: chorismate synthase [Treponema sp.]|nr:chorismate synthase [Treponema sp.]